MQSLGIALLLILGAWDIYHGIKDVIESDSSKDEIIRGLKAFAPSLLYCAVLMIVSFWFWPQSWRLVVPWGLIIGSIVDEILWKRRRVWWREEHDHSDSERLLDHH